MKFVLNIYLCVVDGNDGNKKDRHYISLQPDVTHQGSQTESFVQISQSIPQVNVPFGPSIAQVTADGQITSLHNGKLLDSDAGEIADPKIEESFIVSKQTGQDENSLIGLQSHTNVESKSTSQEGPRMGGECTEDNDCDVDDHCVRGRDGKSYCKSEADDHKTDGSFCKKNLDCDSEYCNMELFECGLPKDQYERTQRCPKYAKYMEDADYSDCPAVCMKYAGYATDGAGSSLTKYCYCIKSFQETEIIFNNGCNKTDINKVAKEILESMFLEVYELKFACVNQAIQDCSDEKCVLHKEKCTAKCSTFRGGKGCPSDRCYESKKVCADKLKEGSKCLAKKQCESGICKDGKCAGEKKGKGESCEKGEDCISGFCRPKIKECDDKDELVDKSEKTNSSLAKVEVAEEGGLSGGVLAGIIIGVLVVVAGIGAAVWWFVFRKKPVEGVNDADEAAMKAEEEQAGDGEWKEGQDGENDQANQGDNWGQS